MNAVRLTRRFVLFIAAAAIALTLVASVPRADARSKPDPDKYARKVEKKLAHYKKNALVHIVFLNSSESTGTLGNLGDHAFTLVNVETNATESHNYVDVDTIGKGSDEVTSPHHHRGIL